MLDAFSGPDRRWLQPIELPLDLCNPVSHLHGGVAVWLMEAAGAHALDTDDLVFYPSSMHVVYLRPLPVGESMRLVVDLAHTTRRGATAHVEIRRDDQIACAAATITYRLLS
ncbi:PaaI family thioesterase [Nocardia sp. NPDC004860]|uniref:PaaI family thioesterase n=1 Tax=Nocardia sp. NPDC004860 TaxID=3154557 RepID=UPI0033A1568D